MKGRHSYPSEALGDRSWGFLAIGEMPIPPRFSAHRLCVAAMIALLPAIERLRLARQILMEPQGLTVPWTQPISCAVRFPKTVNCGWTGTGPWESIKLILR